MAEAALSPEGSQRPLPATLNPKSFDEPVVETVGGMQIPVFGFGTFRLDGGDAYRMTAAAIEQGVRYIDTAQMYGNEAEVGRAVADSEVPRDELFITTKIDNDKHEPDDLTRSLRRSLERLSTDYVDLLLIHWPVHWDRIGATLSTLAQAQGGGYAHHLGVSNFTAEQLEVAQNFAPLEVLQVECHPFFQQHELRRWCSDRKWAFTAYSPLAQGRAIGNETLEKIGKNHGVSGAAVALKWLSTLPQVNVIPRTSSEDHLRQNLAARTLELSEKELATVASLHTGQRLIDPDFGPWND